MGHNLSLVLLLFAIFVLFCSPVESRRRMQRYEEIDDDDDIIDNSFEDDEDRLLAEDSDDDEDVFGGEDDAVDVDMNDEEEEIEVEAVPREPQEQRKPEAKTPARGRISARKMHKRRKPGQSIFQHNYGSKKGAKKKKKRNAKPQEITNQDEQFEINIQPLSRPASENDFMLE